MRSDHRWPLLSMEAILSETFRNRKAAEGKEHTDNASKN
jgi:hypothetical protein